MHKSVLCDAVLAHLNLRPGQVVVDATVGSGGHAQTILERIQPRGCLIGIDQDVEAIQRAQRRLERVGGRFVLKHSNFLDLDRILSALNLKKINAVLLDIGLASEQLEDAKRGFSFLRDGPLDMRMDQSASTPTARDLLNDTSEKDLVKIFYEFGEERHAKRIAHEIVTCRAKKCIETTYELKKLVERRVGARDRYGRIHPATRIFQALRIAVNRELDALAQVLPQAFECLVGGGRLAVISFHSLEDRLVKHFFLSQKRNGHGIILTKKPIGPTAAEIARNPRARSAKLRVIERIIR